MSDGPEAKGAKGTNGTNGRPNRKKRFYHVAPEPKDKRPRPENPSLGPAQDGCRTVRFECLQQLDTLVLALISNGNGSLEELWLGLQAAGEHFSAETAGKVLEKLPDLLAASALQALDLAVHLEKGSAVEAASLPTARSSEASCVNEAFLVLHSKVEANLDAAMQSLIPMPSLEWLSTVAMFYGSLRPSPLPRHILEDCADLAFKVQLKNEPKELWHLSRIAKGAALSGTLGRHKIYGHVADLAAQAVKAGTSLTAETLHDISLALSLLQPWDAEIAKAVSRFREAALVPLERSATRTQVDFIGAASMAGQRNSEVKENQDTFYSSVEGTVGCVAVVDGHGRRGAVLSAAGRDAIAAAMTGLKSASSQDLAQVMLRVDAELLTDQKAEPELSGATCVLVRIDGLGQVKRRLSLVHLGDCGAVLGRKVLQSNGSSKSTWSTMRLTEDHRPGESMEALRLLAAGGRVCKAQQKMPVPPNQQMDPAQMGPPRLWHRQRGQAPGLAMSRGLGDALGKACGLSPHTSQLDMDLTQEDVVLVLGSDGIFDVLSDAEVLHCCRQFIESRSAAEAAEAVTQSARRSWQQRGPYIDDCTCVVIFL